MRKKNEKVVRLQKQVFSAQSHLQNRMSFGFNGSPPPPVTPKVSDEAMSVDAENCKIEGEEIFESKDGCNGNHTSVDEKKSITGGAGGRTSRPFTNVRNSLCFVSSPVFPEPVHALTGHNSPDPIRMFAQKDPVLSVPHGQENNSAGESLPGPHSTFTVGVWEDRNKKCRRTMEDTHAFLYNFLHTPDPVLELETPATSLTSEEKHVTEKKKTGSDLTKRPSEIKETDNGYFAIFDGHAGSFAADWCGRKLHIILEDMIRTNPNIPIPELLDKTFTSVDAQLEKLPLRNSGCTAVIAILRWEYRIPNPLSGNRSNVVPPANFAAIEAAHIASTTIDHNTDDSESSIVTPVDQTNENLATGGETDAKFCGTTIRQRILYTANVGDARIILCRKGKALRLSYDHKGNDENEGKRIASAGGLILNNRVNGVLAVTRALGDNYIKDLVTGHPYTTETVIQPDSDEFIILACDGLWDVCTDQEAVNLIRHIHDPTVAAKKLVHHALAHFSTDNLSCLIVRFNQPAFPAATAKTDFANGVEGTPNFSYEKKSEIEKLMGAARKKTTDQNTLGYGIDDNNFGKGYESNISHISGVEREKENHVEEENGSEKNADVLEG